MADNKQTASPERADRHPSPDVPKLVDAGRQAQLDGARDEGAGRTSIPVENITTANDE